jgi:integrase
VERKEIKYMPWRKYKSKPGKYGPTYHISNGIQVRRIECGTWKIFIKKGGERKNKTIGPGRENLIKAIKIAEKIAPQVDLICNVNSPEQPKSKLPTFKKYSEDWVNENIVIGVNYFFPQRQLFFPFF